MTTYKIIYSDKSFELYDDWDDAYYAWMFGDGTATLEVIPDGKESVRDEEEAL